MKNILTEELSDVIVIDEIVLVGMFEIIDIVISLQLTVIRDYNKLILQILLCLLYEILVGIFIIVVPQILRMKV
jgi:hypothetical protein